MNFSNECGPQSETYITMFDTRKIFPCIAINYGNQQGDCEGVASYGGVTHPIWTDSRANTDPAPGCRTGLGMEEVFTAAVK